MLYDKLKSGSLFIMAGPCVIESYDICLEIAKKCKQACEKIGFTYIFKASFDKANRTSLSSFRGPGLEKGLEVLSSIKSQLDIPIVTDIHEANQAAACAEVCDILQIPAFLCRQTDLLVAAANTKRIVNIKKAQFLSGKDMKYPLEKVIESGNSRVLLTERGSMYGYNNLVVDYRNIIDMQKFAVPVVLDITHSTQTPGGLGGKSGGNPEYSPYYAKMASAIGVRGFFAEVHPEPERALSDGANMVKLENFEDLLQEIKKYAI